MPLEGDGRVTRGLLHVGVESRASARRRCSRSVLSRRGRAKMTTIFSPSPLCHTAVRVRPARLLLSPHGATIGRVRSRAEKCRARQLSCVTLSAFRRGTSVPRSGRGGKTEGEPARARERYSRDEIPRILSPTAAALIAEQRRVLPLTRVRARTVYKRVTRTIQWRRPRMSATRRTECPVARGPRRRRAADREKKRENESERAFVCSSIHSPILFLRMSTTDWLKVRHDRGDVSVVPSPRDALR